MLLELPGVKDLQDHQVLLVLLDLTELLVSLELQGLLGRQDSLDKAALLGQLGHLVLLEILGPSAIQATLDNRETPERLALEGNKALLGSRVDQGRLGQLVRAE